MKTALAQEEKKLYITRKHWIFLLFSVFIVLGIGYIISLLFKPKIIGYLFIFIGILYFYFERKNNIWIITDRRIIDEWGVFSINSRETPLDKINNIVYKKDLIGMIFNYGTVFIQSAAEKGETVIKMIPAPEKFIQAVAMAKQFAAVENLMECPFCKEVIKKNAIRCKHCGSDLSSIGQVFVPKQEYEQKTSLPEEVNSNDINNTDINSAISSKTNFGDDSEDKILERENIYKRKISLN